MMAPSHVICGLGVVVAIGHSTGISPTTPQLMLFMLGTLAPDIDGDGTITKPGKFFLPFIGRALAKILDGVVTIVGAITKAVAGHRGFFHWPILPITMFLVAQHLEAWGSAWFAFGYLVHILCDALTVQGIQLFAPFTMRSYSLGLMRTNSVTEIVVTGLVIVPTVIFGVGMLPESLQDGMRQLIEHYRRIKS